MIPDEILAEYDRQLPAIEEISESVENRLKHLLEQGAIKTHSISSRAKSRESLRAKLARPDRTYHSLWEVTDLVGLRVTTYFEDTIGQVMDLIERHFAVDFHLSVDRRHFKDFRAFGYRSFHYICELGAPLGAAPAKAFRFEIQIRTILQHAWAEIEHDLGYKASDSTPDSIRRRFSRVAGLLEIVDEEFVSIRRDLRSYEASLKDALSDPTQAFPLDRMSLELSAAAADVAGVDRDIARILGKGLGIEVFFPEYLLKMLKLAGYANTQDMRKDLARHRGLLLEIIPPYFEFARKTWKLSASNLESVPSGYCLFFLSHIAILRSPILDQNKVTKLAQFYRELDYPEDEASAYQVATGLIDALKQAGVTGIG